MRRTRVWRTYVWLRTSTQAQTHMHKRTNWGICLARGGIYIDIAFLYGFTLGFVGVLFCLTRPGGLVGGCGGAGLLGSFLLCGCVGGLVVLCGFVLELRATREARRQLLVGGNAERTGCSFPPLFTLACWSP